MKSIYSILVVDDNRDILAALKITLAQSFEEVSVLSSPKTLISTLRSRSYDVVLLDMNFSEDTDTGNEGLFWLNEIKKQFNCEVVLFTAYGDIDLAIKGIKKGAYNFVLKPWNNEKLIATLTEAGRLNRSRTKNKTTELSQTSQMYWGESEKMLEIKNTIIKTAPSNACVLITGENGTGKDLLSKQIHLLSNRHTAPFVSVDMGAMPETLFESELFGHVKGAFTDAHAEHIGKFEQANGGTLFFDEIGNIPIHLQSKLLRALQERIITKIGDTKPISINIRLICATNMNLNEMLTNNSFREDLFYRINTIHLHLPSLRERPNDIIPLAEMFIERFAQQYNKPLPKLNANAIEAMKNYNWSGNIRELQNCMEKAVLLNENNEIQATDLSLRNNNTCPPSLSNNTLDDIERNAIVDSIKKNDGNLSLVAKQLNISRQTLYNKLKKYNL